MHCRLSSFINNFQRYVSSENAGQIKTNFYVEPPWQGGTNMFISGSGHMAKMVVMRIIIWLKLLKFTSSEPEDW